MSESRAQPLARMSILINNYNYGRFVAEAIDSALSQTYENTEVVVVDDGSTDDSREIIASYGDRITQVFQPNGGMGSALNAGFAACSGDFVIFLDSDDLLLPTAAQMAIEQLSDPEVSKVHWPLWQMNGTTRTTRKVPSIALPEGDLREKLIANGPHAASGAPTSGNAWSRRYLESVLPMPEKELRQHADSYLNTLAGLNGEIRLISEPQGYYRVHGENDYATDARISQLRRNLKMYHYRCELLGRQLQKMGIQVQADEWKEGNFHYEWLVSHVQTAEDIEALVEPGAAYAFVDDGAWGDGVLIPDRRRVPFLDPTALEDGYPADDAAAIALLERLRSDEQIIVIAFAESGRWWLEHYKELENYLRSRYARVRESEHVIIFDLK